MQVDQLFFSARRNLKEAQTQLHKLLEILQDGHPTVDSSQVADLIKATARAISEMDTMANEWKQQAHSATKTESFSNEDTQHYISTPLYRDEAKSLEEISKEWSFEFNHLLDNGDVDDEVI